MARKASSPPPRVPSLRRHSTGQGYVELNGKRHYLGAFGKPETEQAYHTLIAEWLAHGRQLPVKPEEITVCEVADRYLAHCQTFTKPDGTSYDPEHVRLSLPPLLKLYRSIPAAEFGPLKLQTVRTEWIRAGLTRSTINGRVGVLKRMFRWAAAQELIPAAVSVALDTVEGLRKGRCAAKEPRVVSAVPLAHVEALQAHVSRQVWGLIQLQLLTGARSGEVLKLRRADLDTTGAIWTVRLEHHKSSHRGKARTLYFGEKAQTVLREFFPGKGPWDYLFSPADAMREHFEKRHESRVTPLSCGNVPGSNKLPTPGVTAGEYYEPDSYRKAITRACKEAEVPRWHPHQLRHTAATRIRKELGLEAAQVWLGHSNADITQVYAEVDHARALQIAAQMG